MCIRDSISKADADILRKLAGEANNINQLAHKANVGGFAGVAAELMLLSSASSPYLPSGS